MQPLAIIDTRAPARARAAGRAQALPTGADTVVTVSAAGDLDAAGEGAASRRAGRDPRQRVDSTVVVEVAAHRRECSRWCSVPPSVTASRCPTCPSPSPRSRPVFIRPYRKGLGIDPRHDPDSAVGARALPQAGRRRRVFTSARFILHDLVVLRKTLKSSSRARSSSRCCWCSCSRTSVRGSVRHRRASCAGASPTYFVAGVVGITMLIQGIQVVSLPMVQHSGWRRPSKTTCARRCWCHSSPIQKRSPVRFEQPLPRCSCARSPPSCGGAGEPRHR